MWVGSVIYCYHLSLSLVHVVSKEMCEADITKQDVQILKLKIPSCGLEKLQLNNWGLDLPE